MELEEYLELYKKLGFCVIPVLPRSKKPAIPWMEYQNRKPTPQELEEWLWEYWKRNEPYNLGVVCGQVSDGLIILDFESPEAYYKFFTKHDKLEEETMTVRTSRGIHVYLKTDKTVLSFKIPQLDLEVRGEGCFTVLPPSIHPSGVQYTINPIFLNNDSDIPIIKDLTESLWNRIEKLGVKKPPDVFESTLKENGKPYRGADPPCIHRLTEGFSEGWRNEAAMRLTSYWYYTRKLRSETVWNKLKEWNLKNKPPIDERELGKILENVKKYECRYGCHSMMVFCEPEGCFFAKKPKPVEPIETLIKKKPVEFIDF